LAFKPGTDDMREAPSLTIAELLRSEGATVRGYDPVSMDNVARTHPWIALKQDAYDLAQGCDAVIVVTEWNEFKQLDMARLRDLLAAPNLVDGRNLYDPALMIELGFNYRAIGRGFEGKGVRNGAE
jgi:UDPglucose 6-dehydrogenase